MKKPLRISNDAFHFVDNSELIEGLQYNDEIVTSNFDGGIDRKLISEFLKSPATKTYVVKDRRGNYQVFIHNDASNETVKISEIGGHFVALIESLEMAEEYRKRGGEGEILNHDIIKDINADIMRFRLGESGIGDYRAMGVDPFHKREHLVCLSVYNHELGKYEKLKCVDLERSIDGNVEKKMSELIDDVNNRYFKDKDKVVEDLAEFTARFIQIHPFADGNGRTLRIITNYLMRIKDLPLINIPADIKKQYNMAINYAIAKSDLDFETENSKYSEYYDQMTSLYGARSEGNNRYKPLENIMKECQIENINEFVSKIIDYRKEDPVDKFEAKLIDLDFDKIFSEKTM